MAISNPQMGDVVNSEDKYNALKDWLEKDGVKDPDQFCTHPAEIAKNQAAQLQQMVQQLQVQAQVLQEEIQKGEKEFANTKKKTTKTVSRAEGELEALDELPAGKPKKGSS